MRRLQDRVALITGGTSGIGEGIALRFAEEGAQIVVAGRDRDRGERVASSVHGLFVECDVTTERDIERAVRTTVGARSRLDCFVASAGDAGVHGPITAIDEEGFDRTVALLLKGVAFGMKHACRVMRSGGSFITIASGAALMAGLAQPVYSACKAAVLGLTRSVALEQSVFGIRVNAICAGGVRTPILAKTLGVEKDEAMTRRVNEAVSASVGAATCLGRIGLPADIAGAAAWLASEDSAYVTGQAIVVDGGQTVGKRLASSELLSPTRPCISIF
jgi:NAD(P)-dependent dehydrogenase (short-subunit alcohol dehydrogenase family)